MSKASIADVIRLSKQIAALSEDEAEKVLSEFESIQGKSEAIRAIFKLGAELRKTNAGMA